jgi:DNA polymerase-3 subunit delta
VKIYPDKLAQDLQRGLKPLYLISGDEPLQANESADLIRQACRKEGFTEREVFHIESKSFNWDEVIQNINSLSLFAEKKLVELRCNNHKPSNKTLVQYLDQPNPDTVLLITTSKLDASAQRAKWFKTMDSIGGFIPVWPLEGANLERWLTNRCKTKGLNINRGAIRLLVERCEGNLLSAAQEIEKLQLLYNEDAINEEMLARAVSDSSRYNVFNLVDTALEGNTRNTLKILDGLQEEGVAEPVILWALCREIRNLASASDMLSRGQEINQVFKAHGIWAKRQDIFHRALQRINTTQLNNLLKDAAQIDLTIKGLKTGDAGQLLRNLAMGLSGKPLAA